MKSQKVKAKTRRAPVIVGFVLGGCLGWGLGWGLGVGLEGAWADPLPLASLPLTQAPQVTQVTQVTQAPVKASTQVESPAQDQKLIPRTAASYTFEEASNIQAQIALAKAKSDLAKAKAGDSGSGGRPDTMMPRAFDFNQGMATEESRRSKAGQSKGKKANRAPENQMVVQNIYRSKQRGFAEMLVNDEPVTASPGMLLPNGYRVKSIDLDSVVVVKANKNKETAGSSTGSSTIVLPVVGGTAFSSTEGDEKKEGEKSENSTGLSLAQPRGFFQNSIMPPSDAIMPIPSAGIAGGNTVK